MRTTIHTLMTSLVLAGMLSACSKNNGFDASSVNTSTPGNNSQDTGSGGTDGGGGTTNTLDRVDLKGYVSSGDYESLKSIDFDKTRGELVLTLPLGMDMMVPQITGSLSQYPDIIFQTTKGSDGRTYFVVRVPVKYVLRGVNSTTPTRLPNGDPLPGVPAGELPSVGFTMNAGDGRRVYIYLGVEVIAVYVESDLLKCPTNFPICISTIPIPIYNQNRTQQLGNLALVLGKNGTKGGFYMATKIPPAIAKILDEHFMN